MHRDSRYTPTWGQCRFCKQSAQQSEMVKYGARHHAHAVCLYQHRGIEALDELHTWQLRHLPILALMEAGVPLEHVHVWSARIASDVAELAAQEVRTGDGDSKNA